MSRVSALLVAAVLLLGVAGCGGGDKQAGTGGGGSATVDPVSGQPLSNFKGYDSYPWRSKLVTTSKTYLREIGGVDGSLGRRSDLSDALNTCSDFENGVDQPTRVKNAVTRFGVDRAVARQVLELTRKYVCPAV